MCFTNELKITHPQMVKVAKMCDLWVWVGDMPSDLFNIEVEINETVTVQQCIDTLADKYREVSKSMNAFPRCLFVEGVHSENGVVEFFWGS